jgi:hypothetical protein
MTRRSIFEYAAVLRPRYRAATKHEQTIILNEFCQTTGYHRKAAIRLLHRSPPQRPAPRGRPCVYGADVLVALRVAWETTDYACGKRLAPFLPALVPILEHHGELSLTDRVRRQLMTISAATIDRLLAPLRTPGLRRPYTTRTAATGVQALVPIRTWADCADAVVGDLEADLVHHCGETTAGFYITSLVSVDLVTGWTSCVPVWGKGQERVRGGLDAIRRALPFPLHGLHSDNGGEFLNAPLYQYCQQHTVVFTRGRAYKKNDQAHVEQKNWEVVRRLIGYDRYSTQAAYAQLQSLYPLICQYMNFFQPVRKIVARERQKSRIIKRYDTAQTPYQRLLATAVLPDDQKRTLATLYERLNPRRLRAQIDAALDSLWALADRDAQAPTGPVTHTSRQ